MDSTEITEEINEAPAIIDNKYDKEEFAYLKNAGFTSEVFKIEIKNLPKVI